LTTSALNISSQNSSIAAPTPFAGLRFDNSYARDLEGLCVAVTPATAPAPRWLKLNLALADSLGLDSSALASPAGLAILSGNALPEGAQPIAQAYAGHQFGGFSPQLGDGRALLLGEIIDPQGTRHDLAFKGSGRTPFSRGGDGKAAVGPVLREYLMGEGMHALGIPTTRVLAAVATGEQVRRETALPGALLSRVASSHLRVGTFQYFAARRDSSMLLRLAEYAIARHDPELLGRDDRYIEFFKAVVARQARLIAQWMSVGFIHGVMNTDNMTLSGETIAMAPAPSWKVSSLWKVRLRAPTRYCSMEPGAPG
jgi:serine/tyrosine/threonine adenylyltransferase